MRGLKRNGWVCGTLIDVASLADAWIKINTGREADVDWTVASLADAWIKIFFGMVSGCRIPRGCVD